MWTLFPLALVVISSDIQALKEERGACVITCDDPSFGEALGLGPCPEGYVCKDNGCGRTCAKVASRWARQLPICHEGCISGCSAGTECVFSGCDSSCQPLGTPSNGGCIDECGTGCPEGYRCVSGSCFSVCQEITIV